VALPLIAEPAARRGAAPCRVRAADPPSSEHAALLATTALFAGLDRVTLARLAAHLEPIAVGAGDQLMRQGDPADGLYLVCRGQFCVRQATRDGERWVRVGIRQRGDLIGEMGLLTGEARSATVVALEDGEVLRLERSHFLDLARRDLTIRGATRPGLRRRPRRVAAGLALALLALAIGWLWPAPDGLTPTGWRALWTLAALVPLMALEVLPDGVAALGLAALWVVGGVAPASLVFGGFSSETWVLMVTVMAAGAAVASRGLLYRLVLRAVSHARGGFVGQVATLSLAGLAAGAAIPNATTRVALIAPATVEIVEALGYRPGGRAAAGLALVVFSSFGCIAPFLTSSSVSLMAFALLPAASQEGLTWGTWLVRSGPLYAVLLLGLLAFVLWRLRPSSPDARSTGRRPGSLALQRAVLGSPSGAEWVTGLATLFLLVGFATQGLHGVEPAWIGVATLVLLALTGALTADTLRTVNWDFALMFGVLAGMADVVAGTGLDHWLAGLAQRALAGLCTSPVLFVVGLAVICFGLSLVLRWVVAVPLLTLTIGPVAGAAGIDPWIVVIVALVACNGFVLPYQNTTYLAMYHGTDGRLFSHAQARPLALVYWLLVLIGLCVSVPLWRLMGLL
jgi:di/tricarboxylate transporter